MARYAKREDDPAYGYFIWATWEKGKHGYRVEDQRDFFNHTKPWSEFKVRHTKYKMSEDMFHRLCDKLGLCRSTNTIGRRKIIRYLLSLTDEEWDMLHLEDTLSCD